MTRNIILFLHRKIASHWTPHVQEWLHLFLNIGVCVFFLLIGCTILLTPFVSSKYMTIAFPVVAAGLVYSFCTAMIAYGMDRMYTAYTRRIES